MSALLSVDAIELQPDPSFAPVLPFQDEDELSRPVYEILEDLQEGDLAGFISVCTGA